MKRILIVANRLPLKFKRGKNGIEMSKSEGGLATGLSSLHIPANIEWVGWPGTYLKSEENKATLTNSLPANLHPVFLTQSEVKNYYEGFCNETVWPLFHYFMEYTRFEQDYWEHYERVNQKFCDKIVEIIEEGDVIWIQDYHLMLLPQMLRKKLDHRFPIGFFLHIPFVSYELFRTFPWGKQILKGILGADLIGFHTYDYMRHFSSSVYRLLGLENKQGLISFDGRSSFVDSFPMGINYEKFHNATCDVKVTGHLKQFKQRFGDFKLILSVDRLDYTKGILQRLKAFNLLLNEHPELKEKVSLIMVIVPSRDNVVQYQTLKEEIDEMVGNINGKHSSLIWTPIHYFYRSVPFEQLAALYSIADIGLVTPLRDGMNLVAKEFVASKRDSKGVLILSEMAGSAIELEDAIRINPTDTNEMKNSMFDAIHMPIDEQERRMTAMQKQVKMHSVESWAKDFISELEAIHHQAAGMETRFIKSEEITELTTQFKRSDKRLILLDYDGTLTPFCDNPTDAIPDEELKTLLRKLCNVATVVLLSGRDHFTMEDWFSDTGVELVAEHGIWNKVDGEWKLAHQMSAAWKKDVFPLLEGFVDKTPGAHIEEKPFSLAFHYRKTDNWLAEIRAPRLVNTLKVLCQTNNLEILHGNKVIEVRIAGINKGNAAQKWLQKDNWDFVLAIGDDTTDEDMFRIMPDNAWSIKTGLQESVAPYRLRNCERVRRLLSNLVKASANSIPVRKKADDNNRPGNAPALLKVS